MDALEAKRRLDQALKALAKIRPVAALNQRGQGAPKGNQNARKKQSNNNTENGKEIVFIGPSPEDIHARASVIRDQGMKQGKGGASKGNKNASKQPDNHKTNGKAVDFSGKSPVRRLRN